MDFLSPRKKRRTIDIGDDTFTTPKKLRRDSLLSSLSTASPLKSPSKHTSAANNDHTTTSTSTTLPPQFARLLNIQASLQHALSVALATSGVSPSIDTGRVPNVLTHLSLTSAMGFKVTCDIDDIKRLCWLWEWDGLTVDAKGAEDVIAQTRPPQALDADEDEDNPFIDTTSSGSSKDSHNNTDWTRGASGFIITPATHFVRGEGRRVPAYGIGIEVEIDLADGKGGGMASVARWTAEADGRKKSLEKKLKRWIEIQKGKEDVKAENEIGKMDIALIPLANLPTLANLSPTKLSSLTAIFKSKSKSTPLSTPSPRKSVVNTPSSAATANAREFAVPSYTAAKNSLPFPSTPRTPIDSPIIKSSTGSSTKSTRPVGFPPQTPSTGSRIGIRPETPRSTTSVPNTPSSSHSNTAATPRRAALLERIRLKSFSEETPTKDGSKRDDGVNMTREQLRSLGQEEMKRRVLLGRLDEVAATIWAAFSSPSQTSSTPLSVARKRRTMRLDEVVRAVVSSARVPISSADARDSVALLMSLCPFFLQPLVIEGEEWVEMPASNPSSSATPPSPRRKEISEQEVRTRSPKSVRMEPKGGLRDVRERIRREIEECSI